MNVQLHHHVILNLIPHSVVQVVPVLLHYGIVYQLIHLNVLPLLQSSAQVLKVMSVLQSFLNAQLLVLPVVLMVISPLLSQTQLNNMPHHVLLVSLIAVMVHVRTPQVRAQSSLVQLPSLWPVMMVLVQLVKINVLLHLVVHGTPLLNVVVLVHV